MECLCDLDNIKEFVYSDKFSRFLVNSVTDFSTAAFILQTLTDKIAELEKEED